ncbi:sodium/solute symporter [Chloropicon primus]|uniref:Sodium/solute symporter n=2 Tax=Chloropicon primus TaxID=1764295 RepID=A0A5B8MGM7_9CHLO|nr:sodium/solute symporter [Chloropicon primus]UPQ98791.1 sodium/solute symporter [Chloropicon primus]|mmetsp:Transcript_9272/g.26372  ORF Transcript_9272/g.26372 Transcript_9272/m.26372 type:complete len:611 (+) Transcript_9272:186-2018(+)|eukprot:QDZ19579.1 sodium/solute symporter [Chloropicon primus]
MDQEGRSLSVVDGVTLVLYFVALLGVGVYATKRQSKQGGGQSTYFLANRAVSWWAVAASLFSSNIGAEHFVGLAGLAAYSGIAVSFYEFGAVLCLLVLAYLFLPVYISSKVTTMPSWLEQRYNAACGTTLVTLSLALYVLTKISATLYAGQLILAETLQVGGWISVGLLIVGTALYTVTGGLSAVIYTEALQTIILFIGGFLLLGISSSEVGGLFSFLGQTTFPEKPHYFSMLRPPGDAEFPWTGFFTGYFVTSLWYWCNDQVIVQRAIAARTVQHGRAGCLAAAYLKLLPGFIMVMPGMIAFQLMRDRGVLNAESERSEYDRAFSWLVMNVMPNNTRGIIVSAMVSALMSSLASVFNSCSTIFTLDVYKKYRPSTTERELVWVGRVAVVIVACLSCAWLPIIPLLGDQIFLWVQKPPSYFAPPLFCLFFWGVVLDDKYANERGALLCLLSGIGIGVLRFLLELVGELGGVASREKNVFVQMNFLHFSALNFVLSSLVMLGWSYWNTRGGREPKDVSKLTFSKRLYGTLRREGIYEECAGSSLEMVRLRPNDSCGDGLTVTVEGEEAKAFVASGPSAEKTLKSSQRWGYAIDCSAVVVTSLFALVLVMFR